MKNDPLVLTRPEDIHMFSLLALRGAVKLEMKGLRVSRGTSAIGRAKRLLKLPPRTRSEEVLRKLTEHIISKGGPG